MQETRRLILEILRNKGECTVDDVVQSLETLRGSITAVTVRHHLNKLREDGLVDTPQILHRSSPGRPQHIFVLTPLGQSQFPNNYQEMTSHLIKEMRNHLSDNQFNVILEGVSDTMVSDANLTKGDLQTRVAETVDYLNEHGYEAEWKIHPDGFVLYTHNCPYHKAAHEDEAFCHLDMRLISKMIGVVPRLLSRISEDDQKCSYLIPIK